MLKHMYILINYKILIIIRAEILEVRMVNLKIGKGFTLAEVLITLGIIGVVAAITIPNLITEHQKRTTVTKLQKAISVMNQAYRLSYDDVGEVSIEDAAAMGAKEYFNKYWAPYIKVLLYCDTYETCGYKTYFFDTFNYTNKPNILPAGYGTGFITMDGFFVNIRVKGGENNGKVTGQIFVDLNGTKKPNMVGKDVFILERRVDGEKGGVVIPFDSDASDEQINNVTCSSQSSEKTNGYGCAEKIRRAGWKIEKDYPWK